MDELFIFPFNGNGLEALDCIGNKFKFIGFIDDTLEKQGISEYGYEVYSRSVLDVYPSAKVLAVPGSPNSYQIRDNIITSLGINKNRFATLIHPKASVSPYSKIGKNVLIMSGVVITSNAIIEDHVCILPNTVIHHDSIVKEYTLIGSNVTVAGNTVINRKCYIGSGTSLINNVSIGENTLVGLGSNVVNSIHSNLKVVGNPAKKIIY